MSIDPSQLYLQNHAPAPVPSGSSGVVQLGMDEETLQRRMQKEEELKAKERSLANLLIALSDSPDLEPGGPGDQLQDDGKPKPGAYRPVIPDEVAQYYLQKVGFETGDVRVCVAKPAHGGGFGVLSKVHRTRLLALAAQKFASDIASDSYQYARTRTLAAAGSGRGRPPTIHADPAHPSNTGAGRGRVDRSRTVLTMEDLSAALQEYGVNASRAPYYL